MKKFYLSYHLKSLAFCGLTLLLSLGAKAWSTVVAKDGSGNYTTVQAAIDAAPTTATALNGDTIFIKNGRYKEKITVPSNKPFVQFVGESVANVVLTFDDFASKPTSCAATVGTQNSASVSINATDFTAINITFENSYGNGSQAVAVLVNNDRAAFKNCRFLGNQDTLYLKGAGTPRCYFRNCYIDGNIDFIFGSAVGIFDSCVVYPKTRTGIANSFITAANTPNGQAYGFVFRNCRIPANVGTTLYTLGRPWPSPSEAATQQKTVYINSMLGASINPAGWSVWDANTVFANITYAEYMSRNFDGTLTNVSSRVSWSQQLSDISTYTNNQFFGTWDPCTTRPDICTNDITPIAVSNLVATKNASSTTINWNISWPVAGVRFQLLKSADNVNFSQLAEISSVNISDINFQLTDAAVPPQGTSFYYYILASKTGYASHSTEVVQVSSLPAIATTGTQLISLCGFSQNVGTPSLSQTFAISASSLVDNLAITPSTNFEVSANGTTWFTNTNPLILTPTGGAYGTANIMVRMNAAAAGNYAGNILLSTTGMGATPVNFAVSGTAIIPPSIVSNVLQTWPFATNANDDAAVRDLGVVASAPSFKNLYVSDGVTVSAVAPYSVTYGQAYGAGALATNNGSWAATANGPGGNLNRGYYQQFTVTAAASFTVRVDSILFNHAFYNTSSGVKLAIAFSKNGFTAPADSVDVAGCSFASPIVPLNYNATGSFVAYYRIALNGNNGINLLAGETLSIRVYNACSSGSSGRYAMYKGVTIKGLSEIALPLTLINFTAALSSNTVRLNWLTANEVNTQNFEIERSKDGIHFTKLATQDAKNIFGNQAYTFTDFSPVQGINYYRLKMNDKNGGYTFSQVLLINTSFKSKLALYPNPVVALALLAHSVAKAGAFLQIFSMDGRKLQTQTASPNSNQTMVNLTSLTFGNYILVFQNGEEKQVLRFTK